MTIIYKTVSRGREEEEESIPIMTNGTCITLVTKDLSEVRSIIIMVLPTLYELLSGLLNLGITIDSIRTRHGNPLSSEESEPTYKNQYR